MAQATTKVIDYLEEDTLNVYTDGSMLPGPGRGGTGVIFILINEVGEEEEDVPYLARLHRRHQQPDGDQSIARGLEAGIGSAPALRLGSLPKDHRLHRLAT